METIGIFISHYKQIDKIRTINTILLTVREVDVISCLINGRSVKKIAFLLSISPKTVEVHIRNIMLKLGCNSREKLIDFIELSGNHLGIKEHYHLILEKNHFNNCLKNIKNLAFSKNKILSILHQESLSEEGFFLINAFKETLAEFKVKSSINLLTAPKSKERYTIHIVTNEAGEKALISYLEPSEIEVDHLIFCFNFSSERLSNKENYRVLFINHQSSFWSTVLELLIAIDISKDILVARQSFQKTRAHQSIHRDKETLFFPGNKENSINDLDRNLETVHFKFPRPFEKSIFEIILVLFVVMTFVFYFYKDTNKELARAQADLILPENTMFIPRAFLIEKMDEILKKDKSKIKQLILVGIGGIGKTTLARTYAMQKSNNIVWEINSENELEIIKSFEKFAVVLAKNREEREELEHLHMLNNIDHLKTKLISIIQNQLHENQDWLLIYDNVYNVNNIIQYLPRGEKIWGQGKILITTRNQNIIDSQYINKENIVQVPELSLEEKKTLFFKIFRLSKAEMKDLKNQDFLDKNLHRFLDQLPSYPLDVSTAAYFLKNTNVGCERYLKDIEEPGFRLKVLGASFLKDVDRNFNTRYNIVIATIKKIIDQDQNFRYKLFELGLLTPNSAPFLLLERDPEQDSIIPFVRELAKYSLLNYNNTIKLGNISLHRSIHNIIYLYLSNTLEPPLREKHIKNMGEHISSRLKLALNKEDINTVKSIVFNAEAFIKKVPSCLDEKTQDLRYQMGRAYRYLGRFKEAIIILEGIIHFEKNTDVLLELGTIYINEGKYNKAIFLIESALNLARKKYGEDSIQVARAEIRLDTPYRKVKKYHVSKKVLEHSLAIHSHYPNSDPGDIAWIYTKIAYLMIKLGDATEAFALFNKSLNIQLALYGPNSIRSAWTQVRMAHAYKELHQYELAQNILKNSLKVYQQHFGKNHLKTAWVLCFVGEIEGLLGNFKQAEIDLQAGLEIQKKYHGENHIRIAWGLNKLSELYKRANMLSKANHYTELFHRATTEGDEEKL